MGAILQVKKLDTRARVPAYAHPGDAGLDLFSIEEQEIPPGGSGRIRTGIAVALPPGTEGQVRPRSGLAHTHQVTVLNSPGTIDSGYRGEVKVILINHGKKTFSVQEGMKIAQLLVKPVLTVEVKTLDQLPDTRRGGGGFGSTGL